MKELKNILFYPVMFFLLLIVVLEIKMIVLEIRQCDILDRQIELIDQNKTESIEYKKLDREYDSINKVKSFRRGIKITDITHW